MTPRPPCLNCGSPRTGRWCSECGQDGDRRLRSIPALVRELASALVDLDGRAVTTLRRVIAEPGSLTREYARGHFVAQLPPIRLYLAVSAVYFLLAPLVGNGLVRLAGGQGNEAWAQLGPLAWDSEILLVLLIPLFALAARPLLAGRARAFEEVFVFSVHYQVFFLLAVMLGGITGAVVSRSGSLMAVVTVYVVTMAAPLVYLGLSLRTAFRLSGLRLAGLAVLLFLLHLLCGQGLQNLVDTGRLTG